MFDSRMNRKKILDMVWNWAYSADSQKTYASIVADQIMSTIPRRDLVLLLIGTDPTGNPSDGVGGMTRLQKFLYLLEQENGISPKDGGFEFTAYKAGPYSAKLYDDIEFLGNLGYLESEAVAEATDAEAAEVDVLDFEGLIGDASDDPQEPETDAFGAADAYEERKFRLTEKGFQRMKTFFQNKEYAPVIEAIKNVKGKYGKYSLNDLLYHVYTKYPNMTTESEIKDKVLGRKS